MGINDHLLHKSICNICGREYETRLHNQKYCTHACALRAEAARRKGTPEIKPYQIFERDGFKCHYCGKSPHLDNIVLTIDHIIPLILNGDDQENNLITACNNCNSLKGSKLLSLEIIRFLKSR